MVGLIMKLTDEQIAELAPDWATHYKEHGSDILFEGEEFFIYYDTILTRFRNKKSQLSWGINENSKPIPRKPFDISEHEFSDTAKDCGVEFSVPAWAYPDIEINVKDITGGDNTAVLMKEHAVAIAKHFKLTAEDLK